MERSPISFKLLKKAILGFVNKIWFSIIIVVGLLGRLYLFLYKCILGDLYVLVIRFLIFILRTLFVRPIYIKDIFSTLIK